MKRLGPSSGQPPITLDLLFTRVLPEPNSGCWMWTGTLYPTGYGQFSIGGKNRPAHRVAYELACGAIPEGLHLDHLCRVRCCINPQHLEAVTQVENIRRGLGGANNRAKSHCPSGHPYAGDNLIINTQGRRICAACSRLIWARAYEAKKQRKAAAIKEITQ